MDLFAKDHPLEAAALRTQSAKPRLRNFVFEELPPAARRRIYRALLLKREEVGDRGVSQSDDDSYVSEHGKWSDLLVELMIEIGEWDNQMHPEIMCTNKRIHEEAAAVLYGENWFTWTLCGAGHQPMWTWPLDKKSRCPPHYSRLVTKMCLVIETMGDEDDPAGADDAIYWTTTNIDDACRNFALNDFEILKVDFYSGLGYRYGGSARKGYYGERCLESLKKCRAEKVGIDSVHEGGADVKLTSVEVPHQRVCFSSLCGRIEGRDRRSQGCQLSGLSQSEARRAGEWMG